MGKRPIDRQRESAGYMDIGSPDDPSAITGFLTIGDVLYVIKEKGVYEVKLADAIDPDRKNPAVPNTQQRILAYGSDSKLVGRTLLTAERLFNKTYLPKTIDCDQAMAIMIEIVVILAAMQHDADDFGTAEQYALENFENRRRNNGSVLMPSVGDVASRCEPFIQRADHALRALLNLVKLFYGRDAGRRWFESFTEQIERTQGKDDPFSQFLRQALPFLKSVRNARNCVEHPTSNQRIVTTDFAIDPNAKIMPPMIEVIHPKTPEPAFPVSAFMTRVADQIVEIIELMIAYICSKHVQKFAGFAFQVVELPKEQRSNEHVRFSYGLYDGARVIPAS